MATQRTLSIIKPDATERNHIGGILAKIEAAGLSIVEMKMMKLTKEQAEGFYAVHSERPFFGELVEFMTRSRVVVSVLEGEDAVAKYVKLSGCGALRKVTTPFLDDYDPNDPAVNTQSATKGALDPGGSSQDNEGDGELKHCAASILMKLLYCARMCRYDFLHPIGRLACLVTKWDKHCDKMLHRLMC